MNKPQKNKNTFVAVAILALVIAVGGWYYLSSASTSLELIPDQSSYFNVDEPKVEVLINNYKDATDGEAFVEYNNDVLSLLNVNSSEGVSYRELGSSLIFELNEEFFAAQDNLVAELSFSSSNPGTGKVNFNQEKSFLNNSDGNLELSYKDTNFGIGVAGRIDEENGQEGKVVTPKEYEEL
ncbi:hypothetical protein ACFL10_02070 [Patescibacteria group bacterium]